MIEPPRPPEAVRPVVPPVIAAPGWRARLARGLHDVFEAPTLGQLVLRRELVTRQQLAHAIAIQRLSGERLGHVLVRLHYLGEDDLSHLLGRQRLVRWLVRLVG